jgi:hypothetical protein
MAFRAVFQGRFFPLVSGIWVKKNFYPVESTFWGQWGLINFFLIFAKSKPCAAICQYFFWVVE